MKQTYKTEHPTIKKISIGDRFVLNNGGIVTFIQYEKEDAYWSFKTNIGWYNIKQRYITLKDKINQL